MLLSCFRLQLLNLVRELEILLKVLLRGFLGKRSQFGVSRWHPIQKNDVMNQRLVRGHDSRQLRGGYFDRRFAFGARSDASALELGKKILGGGSKT